MQEFEFSLEDNLFQLHQELKDKIYLHSNYTSFFICDPKLRRISKAGVKDRVLRQAVFRVLYPIFDKSFIYDSYSCRINKGTHRAVKRLSQFCQKLSQNNHQNIYILKCDIQKFFDSIDQTVLLELIKKRIQSENVIWLINKIIKSFYKEKNKGLPLGNVTSQLFANIYLNELDQFVKHELKIKYYLRYCDDFVILDKDKDYLIELIQKIGNFLKSELNLKLHARKIIFRKYHQGIDFLGYVVLPYHRVLRTKTKKRMVRKIEKRLGDIQNSPISSESLNQSLQSFLGILKHCRGYGIEKDLRNLTYFIK